MIPQLAYILCAGEGTRLIPITEYIPKCLLPVVDKPMVCYVFDELRCIGIKKFIVNLFVHFREIRDNLEAYAKKNKIQIIFLQEKRILGTGGAIKNALNYLNEPFFLVNCDFIPSGFSFKNMVKAHKTGATLALRPKKSYETYNPVGVKRKYVCRVENIFGCGGRDYVFLGVHILTSDILKFLDKRLKIFDIFNGLYKNAFLNKEKISAYIQNDYWFSADPGTLKGYLQTNFKMLELKKLKSYISKRSKIGDSKIGDKSIICDNVVICDNAKISNSIILSDSYIKSDIVIKDSIVLGNPDRDLINSVYVHGRIRNF
ncbi:MAG: NDP-sugar synthase [Candidatus Hydrogenedentota bacterium]